MEGLAKKILNTLLDKYEKSKSFSGDNKIKQSFFIEPAKMFHRYADDAEYEFFTNLNECIEDLRKRGFVNVLQRKNGVIQKVILDADEIDAIYSCLNRTSRKAENEWLDSVWEEILIEQTRNTDPDMESYYRMIGNYITAGQERLRRNKTVAYFESDRSEYADLLLAVKQAMLNKQEIYIRDFSIYVFSDSKRMESLKRKVQSFLFEYGDFEEKDYVLEECGIVDTPTYVAMKGNAVLKVGTQEINLVLLKGDIALSTESIKELKSIKVLGNRVITIENMTSFHDYEDRDDFAIYLGGFHNKVKREFIQFLFSENPDKQYYHFGDIDAGGFYIFEHLCKKTGIRFHTLNMNIDVLKQYKKNWKGLTQNDRRRIRQLLGKLEDKSLSGMEFEDYREILKFMLDYNCKMEQEGLKFIN